MAGNLENTTDAFGMMGDWDDDHMASLFLDENLGSSGHDNGTVVRQDDGAGGMVHNNAFQVGVTVAIPDPTPLAEMSHRFSIPSLSTPIGNLNVAPTPLLRTAREGDTYSSNSAHDSNKKRRASDSLASPCSKTRRAVPTERDAYLTSLVSKLCELKVEFKAVQERYKTAFKESDVDGAQEQSNVRKAEIGREVQETVSCVITYIETEYWRHQPYKASTLENNRWEDFRPFLDNVHLLTMLPTLSLVGAMENLVDKWQSLPKRKAAGMREAAASKFVGDKTKALSKNANGSKCTVKLIQPWHIVIKDNAGRKTFATLLFRQICWNYKVQGSDWEVNDVINQTRKELQLIFPDVDENELARVFMAMPKKKKAKNVAETASTQVTEIVPEDVQSAHSELYGFCAGVPSFVPVGDRERKVISNYIHRLLPGKDWPFADVLKFLRLSTDALEDALKENAEHLVSSTGIMNFRKKVAGAESCASLFENNLSVAQTLQGALVKDFADLLKECDKMLEE